MTHGNASAPWGACDREGAKDAEHRRTFDRTALALVQEGTPTKKLTDREGRVIAYITINTNDHGGFTALHERLSGHDLENASFCDRLVERLRWAVEDTEPTRDLLASPPPAVTLAEGMLAALDPRATRP